MRASCLKQILSVTVLLAFLISVGIPAVAAPLFQTNDPVAQCAKGVQLYVDGKTAEALPLIEAGFAGLNKATFANPDDKGKCALAFALLRHKAGNRAAALEAYKIALEIFRSSRNREYEGYTLNGIQKPIGSRDALQMHWKRFSRC